MAAAAGGWRAACKRKARARRLLLEDHHHGAVDERPVLAVGLELALDPAGALEDVLEFVAAQIPELQEMPRLHAFAACGPVCSRNLRMSGARIETICRASGSRSTSGGSSRTTLSMVTL